MKQPEQRLYYSDYAPVIEDLYLQGVEPAVIAEVLDTNLGTLRAYISRWDLRQVKALRDFDLAREAAERYTPQTRRSMAIKLLDEIGDEWVTIKDLQTKSTLSLISIRNYLGRFSNAGLLERRHALVGSGKPQEYRRARARRAA